jgi:transcriptional regulator with XRE-family HTH domain
MKQRGLKHQTNNFDLRTLLLIRRTHGMPAAIARVAQVSPGFVSDVLNGRKRPSPRFLAALPRASELAGASFKVASKG